jgi:hypothetical protein
MDSNNILFLFLFLFLGCTSSRESEQESLTCYDTIFYDSGSLSWVASEALVFGVPVDVQLFFCFACIAGAGATAAGMRE